jgi:hypothetical protein
VNSGAAVTHELRKALHDRHTMCKRSISVGVAWTAIEVLREALPETVDIISSSADHNTQQQQDWYDPSNSDSNGNNNASQGIDRREKAQHARYNELHPTTVADTGAVLHSNHTRYTCKLTLHYAYQRFGLSDGVLELHCVFVVGRYAQLIVLILYVLHAVHVCMHVYPLLYSGVSRVHHEPFYQHLHMPLPQLYIAAGGCKNILQTSSNTATVSTAETEHPSTESALIVTSQQKLIKTATTSDSGINTVAGAVGSIVRVAINRVLQQSSLQDAIRRSSASGFGIRRKKSIYDEHVSATFKDKSLTMHTTALMLIIKTG